MVKGGTKSHFLNNQILKNAFCYKMMFRLFNYF